MNTEQTHSKVIQITAHSQCLIHLIDQLDFKGMNPEVQRLFKDSRDIFKAVNNHLVKKMGVLYEEVYKVDPDTIETLIDATLYKIGEFKGLEIEDYVTIKK